MARRSRDERIVRCGVANSDAPMRIRKIPPGCVGEGFYPSRAECTRKIAQRTATTQSVRRGRCRALPVGAQSRNCIMFGETAKRPVGADDPVRPLGNRGFAATFRKNGRASCGSMWASTPTNVVRIRIGASIFAGLCRRADRVVRPYKALYGVADSVCRFASACRAILQSPTATAPFTQGSLTGVQFGSAT